MPTLQHLAAAAVPFTQAMADRLTPALRGSALYSRNRQLYPDVSSLVAAHVGTSTETARILSAVLTVIFDEAEQGGLGAAGLKGGRDGLEFSEKREREEELTYALDALIDRPVGATLDGALAFGSVNLTNQAVW